MVAVPVLGGIVGTALAGPVGLAAGVKLGTVGAVGGGVLGTAGTIELLPSLNQCTG